MATVQVQLPDGRIVPVEVPDTSPPVDNSTDWKTHGKAALMMGKDALMSGMAGIGEVLAQVPKTVARINPVANTKMLLQPDFAAGVNAIQPNLDSVIKGWEKKNSDLTGLPQAAVKGAASAILGPGNLPKAALAGSTAGLAGDATHTFLEGNPRLQAVLSPLAALVTGGAAGWGLGTKQSVAQQDIRRELKDLPPQDWAAALKNILNFQGVGAKSATAADAFPGNGRIVPLAARAANSEGGEALATKLAGREADLAGLSDTFLNRLGPPVDPARVANNVADSANSFLGAQKEHRSAGLANRLAGKTITLDEAQSLHDNLMQVAAIQRRPEMQAAYKEVATKLLSTAKDLQGKPIPLQFVQDLSFQIKSLKEAAKNPLNTQNGSTQIAAGNLREPIGIAERGLEAYSPDFAGGMQDFRGFSDSLRNLWEGPIGKLADRNPLSQTATPLGRLNAVVDGNSPSTISNTMRTLQNPQMTWPVVDPAEIARALYQQKMNKGSMNPGQDVRGLPGSNAEGQLDALISASGKNPAQVKAPLQAADQMQNLTAATGITGPATMSPGQLLLRPFRTLDMMITGHGERKIQGEIAQLLAEATPESLRKLQAIAMFDPSARKFLSLQSGVMPAALFNQESK